MIRNSHVRSSALAGLFLLIASAGVGVDADKALADAPDAPVMEAFSAPLCAGETVEEPTENVGFAVVDLTEVFGARLDAYNEGRVVPLYDAYGGSILISSSGEVNPQAAAYPPLCGTRYVGSAGGPVSEWMFCTDLAAQSCGDTDALGNLVDDEGNVLNPMTNIDRNERLSAEQHKLIAYLVQNGHSYAGVGNQSWGGVTTARADLGTNERLALQTLIWCISDPPTGTDAFAETCDANMDAAEQARLLQMIPDIPEMVLALSSSSGVLEVGDVAEFALTTNVFNTPISLVTGGSASVEWAVCSGSATLGPSGVTVAGSDPSVPITVTLCARADPGDLTLSVIADPPSVLHMAWAKSFNDSVDCQVYATFEQHRKVTVTSSASAAFAAEGLAATGTETARLVLWGGLVLIAGAIFTLWSCVTARVFSIERGS